MPKRAPRLKRSRLSGAFSAPRTAKGVAATRVSVRVRAICFIVFWVNCDYKFQGSWSTRYNRLVTEVGALSVLGGPSSYHCTRLAGAVMLGTAVFQCVMSLLYCTA